MFFLFLFLFFLIHTCIILVKTSNGLNFSVIRNITYTTHGHIYLVWPFTLTFQDIQQSSTCNFWLIEIVAYANNFGYLVTIVVLAAIEFTFDVITMSFSRVILDFRRQSCVFDFYTIHPSSLCHFLVRRIDKNIKFLSYILLEFVRRQTDADNYSRGCRHDTRLLTH